jgi:hypothetical protein
MERSETEIIRNANRGWIFRLGLNELSGDGLRWICPDIEIHGILQSSKGRSDQCISVELGREKAVEISRIEIAFCGNTVRRMARIRRECEVFRSSDTSESILKKCSVEHKRCENVLRVTVPYEKTFGGAFQQRDKASPQYPYLLALTSKFLCTRDDPGQAIGRRCPPVGYARKIKAVVITNFPGLSFGTVS